MMWWYRWAVSNLALMGLSLLQHWTSAPVLALPSTVHRLPDIYWNSSNPIFRIDTTDHIMDVNQNNQGVHDYDQVNIVCPLYDAGATPREEDTEKYIIYHVNKEEYSTCQIMSGHPRILAKCDKPYKLLYFTISFRPFSPTPGALEFTPGKDYYFISTSSKTDLHRRVDGMCRTNNMRIVFKVAAGPRQTRGGSNHSQISSTTTTTTTTASALPAWAPPAWFASEAAPSAHLYEHESRHPDERFHDILMNPHEDVEDHPPRPKEDKKKKRKKKRPKPKKEEQQPAFGQEEAVADLSIHELVTESVIPATTSHLVSFYDNQPPIIRHKEPSLVEKVNNLMRQEASAISSLASANGPTNSLLITILCYSHYYGLHC